MLLVVAGALAFGIDRLTKSTLGASDRQAVAVGSILTFRRVESASRRYSSASARFTMVTIWIAAVAATVLLSTSGSTFQSNVALAGAGTAIGGAAGNLADIVRSQFVVDFIDLGWWPVFNIADVAIIGGLAVAFFAH